MRASSSASSSGPDTQLQRCMPRRLDLTLSYNAAIFSWSRCFPPSLQFHRPYPAHSSGSYRASAELS